MKSTPHGFPAWYPGWLLPVERGFWRLRNIIRNPRVSLHDWRKWHSRPKVGDQVMDCRDRLVTVVRFGGTEDDLIFDDGHAASWMNCCDWPEVKS